MLFYYSSLNVVILIYFGFALVVNQIVFTPYCFPAAGSYTIAMVWSASQSTGTTTYITSRGPLRYDFTLGSTPFSVTFSSVTAFNGAGPLAVSHGTSASGGQFFGFKFSAPPVVPTAAPIITTSYPTSLTCGSLNFLAKISDQRTDYIEGAAVSFDGNFAYANNDYNDLWEYYRAPATGLLTFKQVYFSVNGSYYSTSTVIPRDGLNIYYVTPNNPDSAHAAVFDFPRSAGTGLASSLVVTWITVSPANIYVLCLSADELYLYIGFSGGLIGSFTRNPGAVGSLSGLTAYYGLTPPINTMAASSDNNYIYCNAGALIYWFSRVTTTGSLTILSSISLSETVMSMAFDSSFKLLFAQGSTASIFVLSRSTSTGALTLSSTTTYVPSYSGWNWFNGLAVSPDSICRSVFICESGGNILHYSSDAVTGALSFVAAHQSNCVSVRIRINNLRNLTSDHTLQMPLKINCNI